MDSVHNKSLGHGVTIGNENNTTRTLHERLISLEQSKSTIEEEEEEISAFSSLYDHAHMNHKSELEFQEEINRLKRQSTKKFKDKWDEILYKYSQIDDEKESDEIDLVSGEILIDNGHLKSLASKNTKVNGVGVVQNIWGNDYNAKNSKRNLLRAERSRIDAKRKLKDKLKESQTFHNSQLHGLPLPVKGLHQLKINGKAIPEDNLFIIKPSPTKKQKVSPSKSVQLYSQKNEEMLIHSSNNNDAYNLAEDDSPSKLPLQNLRLFDMPRDESTPISSPKIKGRETPHLEPNIIVNDTDLDYDSDLQQGSSNSDAHAFDGPSAELSQDYQNEIVDDREEISSTSEDDTDQSSFDSDLAYGAKCIGKDECENLERELERQLLSDLEEKLAGSNEAFNTTQNSLHHKPHNECYQKDKLYEECKNSDLSSDGSFTVDTKQCQNSSDLLFDCPFPNCNFTKTNDAMYKEHLLVSHTTELQLIGYPVHSRLNNLNEINLSESSILKVKKQFPLHFEIPALPQTIDKLPLECGNVLDDTNFCKLTFVDFKSLKEHQNSIPNECSQYRQIFECPLLGCGYTSNDYMIWRKHFIRSKHNVDFSSLQDKVPKPYHLTTQSHLSQKKPVNKVTSTHLSKNDIREEIEQMFRESD